jgi:hypothetical protein
MSPREELIEALDQLAEPEQRALLNYARQLRGKTPTLAPKGVPFESLRRFMGSIPSEDLKQIETAIEEGCEGIDRDEW